MDIKNEILFRTPFVNLIKVIWKRKDGRRSEWIGVERPNAKGAVAVVAITVDKELVLVRQPRPLLGDYTIELPAGLCDVEGEDLFDTAKRELMEETGYHAHDIEMFVGRKEGHPVSAGITSEKITLVIARDVRKVTQPQLDEETEPILIPIEEAHAELLKISGSEPVGLKALLAAKVVEVQKGVKKNDDQSKST